MKFLAFISLAFLAVSCGHSYSGSHWYEYSENGCSTGEHTFKSKIDETDLFKQYCDALKNDKLNNYCAPNLRREAFITDCISRGFSWL